MAAHLAYCGLKWVNVGWGVFTVGYRSDLMQQRVVGWISVLINRVWGLLDITFQWGDGQYWRNSVQFEYLKHTQQYLYT